jgi:hypothetical protein
VTTTWTVFSFLSAPPATATTLPQSALSIRLEFLYQTCTFANIGDRGVADPANVVAVERQNICSAWLQISKV